MRDLIPVAIVLVASGACIARPSETEVQGWLATEFENALAFPSIQLVEVQYTIEKYHVVDLVELEALRKDVATTLDHAKKFQLSLLEKKAKGPSIESRRAWIMDEYRWRVNSDFLDQPGIAFSDLVVGPDIAWSSTQTELALINPEGGYPPDRDLSRATFLIAEPISRLLYGGIDAIPSSEVDFATSTIQGNDLTISILPSPRSPSRRATITARWDEGSGRGFINEIKFFSVTGDGSIPSSRIVVEGWRQLPELGVWTAESVHFFRPADTLDGALHFDGAERIEPAVFAKVVAPPGETSEDAVRGKLVWSTINDYRRDPISPKVSGVNSVPGAVIAKSSTSKLMQYALGISALVLVGMVILFRVRGKMFDQSNQKRGVT
jgi:hypothetical protein